MAANSLPGFPTEIIIQIYILIANFATATALSSTSRRFRSIWETYSATICYAILVRTIACYDDAFGYVKAQPLDDARSEKIRDTGLVAIEVVKQFHENAAIACLALRYYEAQVSESVSCGTFGPRNWERAQRTCFLQAWYRIHTLASLSSDPLPNGLLPSLSLLEFKQMMVVFCWLMYRCPEEQRVKLHICYRIDSQSRIRGLPKSPISPLHWYNLEAYLSSLNDVLVEYLLNDQCSKCGGVLFWLLRDHEFG